MNKKTENTIAWFGSVGLLFLGVVDVIIALTRTQSFIGLISMGILGTAIITSSIIFLIISLDYAILDQENSRKE